MNQFEFAEGLIRAPWLSRLLDRTFLATVGTCVTAITGCVAAWRTPEIPINEKVNLTLGAMAMAGVVVTMWNKQEKDKDKAIGTAAIAAANPKPESINAGGDVNMGSSSPDKANNQGSSLDSTTESNQLPSESNQLRPTNAIDEAVEWREEMPGDVPQGKAANVPVTPVVTPLPSAPPLADLGDDTSDEILKAAG